MVSVSSTNCFNKGIFGHRAFLGATHSVASKAKERSRFPIEDWETHLDISIQPKLRPRLSRRLPVPPFHAILPRRLPPPPSRDTLFRRSPALLSRAVFPRRLPPSLSRAAFPGRLSAPLSPAALRPTAVTSIAGFLSFSSTATLCHFTILCLFPHHNFSLVNIYT